ncbi:MAG: GNAT family N-acetyltransferase [Phycisphaerales bacterium JB039]
MGHSEFTSTGAISLPASLRLSAARRMVDASGPARDRAAASFLEAAPEHGIDLDLFWGVVGPDGQVAEAALAVLGAGRTAMLFVSRPADGADHPEARAESVRAACAGLQQRFGQRVVIAQGLPEPSEPWAERAFRDAGFLHVGNLAYLSRPLRAVDAATASQAHWPPGVAVRPLRTLARGSEDRRQLAEAMERSYQSTLDCPELCGLRETEDVIDSHQATGRWTGSMWRLVTLRGQPEGCILLNPSPAHRSVELVYIGLGPALRGRGLGLRLLQDAIGAAAARRKRDGADTITCAVDRRNAPALRLYQRLGFREVSARLAFVRSLDPAPRSSTFRPAHAD